MRVDVFNLIAAILCTVGAGAGFIVAWLSPSSEIIQWALWSAGLGTLGCLVWAVASLISIVGRVRR